jgi:hypothetical protein
MGTEDQRLSQAFDLWQKASQSGYFVADLAHRSSEQVRALFKPIQDFLVNENLRYNRKCNAAFTIANAFDAVSTYGEGSVWSVMMLMLGAREPQHLIVEGKSYVAAEGTYSSIYTALLAILLDELTIEDYFEKWSSYLNDPKVAAFFDMPFTLDKRAFLIAMYRGQRRDWPLLPKVARTKLLTSGLFGFFKEMRLSLQDGKAKGKCRLALERLPSLSHLTKLEWEALYQHYGLPTSLLDFTTNLEVAAFFATRGAKGEDVGVIYRIHPFDLLCSKLYSSFTMARLGRSVRPEDRRFAAEFANFHKEASRAAERVRAVIVPGVLRIKRQDAVFLRGFSPGAATTFLQPIFFHQHNDVSYENAATNVTAEWLFASDDPVGLLMESTLKSIGLVAV